MIAAGFSNPSKPGYMASNCPGNHAERLGYLAEGVFQSRHRLRKSEQPFRKLTEQFSNVYRDSLFPAGTQNK